MIVFPFIVEQYDGQPVDWRNYPVAFRTIPDSGRVPFYTDKFRTVNAGVTNADSALPNFNVTSTQDIINTESEDIRIQNHKYSVCTKTNPDAGYFDTIANQRDRPSRCRHLNCINSTSAS